MTGPWLSQLSIACGGPAATDERCAPTQFAAVAAGIITSACPSLRHPLDCDTVPSCHSTEGGLVADHIPVRVHCITLGPSCSVSLTVPSVLGISNPDHGTSGWLSLFSPPISPAAGTRVLVVCATFSYPSHNVPELPRVRFLHHLLALPTHSKTSRLLT